MLPRQFELAGAARRQRRNAQQVNLAAEGFSKIASRFPGFPLIVGPFGYFDARAVFTQSLIDFNLLANERSSRQNAAATTLNYQDMREAVVLVVGATYLQTIAAARLRGSCTYLLLPVGGRSGLSPDLERAAITATTQLIASRSAGRLANGFPPNVLRTDQEGTITLPM